MANERQTRRSDLRPVVEWCRECRDDGRQVIAEFLVWGKLFPPEVIGPRCTEHVAEHLGWKFLSQIGQSAIFDLRGVYR